MYGVVLEFDFGVLCLIMDVFGDWCYWIRVVVIGVVLCVEWGDWCGMCGWFDMLCEGVVRIGVD